MGAWVFDWHGRELHHSPKTIGYFWASAHQIVGNGFSVEIDTSKKELRFTDLSNRRELGVVPTRIYDDAKKNQQAFLYSVRRFVGEYYGKLNEKDLARLDTKRKALKELDGSRIKTDDGVWEFSFIGRSNPVGVWDLIEPSEDVIQYGESFHSIELHSNPKRGGFAFIENGKEVNFQSSWRHKRSDRLKEYLRRSKGTLESREPKPPQSRHS